MCKNTYHLHTTNENRWLKQLPQLPTSQKDLQQEKEIERDLSYRLSTSRTFDIAPF